MYVDKMSYKGLPRRKITDNSFWLKKDPYNTFCILYLIFLSNKNEYQQTKQNSNYPSGDVVYCREKKRKNDDYQQEKNFLFVDTSFDIHFLSHAYRSLRIARAWLTAVRTHRADLVTPTTVSNTSLHIHRTPDQTMHCKKINIKIFLNLSKV